MEIINIGNTKPFVVSQKRQTRKAIVKQNSGATQDYSDGLLLAVDTNGKLFPSDETHYAVCALINPIAKEAIKAADVEAEVVFLVGLGSGKVMESNPDLRVTGNYIEKSAENGIDVVKIEPFKNVELVSLAVSGSWTNTQYTEQNVDLTGLVFKATYSDGGVETVSVSHSPAKWSATPGSQTATFSYTEGGITKTCTKNATVVLDVPSSLAITGSWTNAQIVETAPDITGLTATATYLSGKKENVTSDVSVSPEAWGAEVGEQTATLSYTEGEVTVSAEIVANVEAAPVIEESNNE